MKTDSSLVACSCQIACCSGADKSIVLAFYVADWQAAIENISHNNHNAVHLVRQLYGMPRGKDALQRQT